MVFLKPVHSKSQNCDSNSYKVNLWFEIVSKGEVEIWAETGGETKSYQGFIKLSPGLQLESGEYETSSLNPYNSHRFNEGNPGFMTLTFKEGETIGTFLAIEGSQLEKKSVPAGIYRLATLKVSGCGQLSWQDPLPKNDYSQSFLVQTQFSKNVCTIKANRNDHFLPCYEKELEKIHNPIKIMASYNPGEK